MNILMSSLGRFCNVLMLRASLALFVKRILDNKAIPYSFVGALKRRS